MGIYDDFDEVTNPTKISKINAAALINLILSDLWKDSYRHSRNGEFSKWNADLNCIWMELAGDVDENSEEEIKFKEIDSKIAKAGDLTRKKATGFEQIKKEDIIKQINQYKLLMDKALFLKRLQNNQGKGTAYREDIDSYMD